MSKKDLGLYAAIFKTKEFDVRTFADVMRRELAKNSPPVPGGVAKTDFDEVASGETKKIKAPEFVQQESGFIRIEHGWHHDDYVWHVGTNHPRKDWKVSPDRLIYAIAATLDTMIPRTVKVNIYPPVADWEIKEYTIKALEVGSVWNVTKDMLTGATEKLFKVLNALV